MTKIREVMTSNLVSCNADATLQEVAQKMLDEDTGFMPLVDDDRIIGVITDRDIVVRATATGLDPKTTKAGEYGTGGAACVQADTPVEEAIKVMENLKVRRLLVIEGERPIGVVSLGDLAECTPQQAEEVLVEVSKSPKTLAHGRPG